MTTIYAKTSDQLLTATILPKVACNNKNTVLLHVDFDSAWDGLAKSALFYTSHDPTVYEVVFDAAGSCTIPHEVLAASGHLFIGIKGIKSTGEVKTSSLIQYKILPGTPSMVVSDPSPNVYSQLLSALGSTNNAIAVERARINSLSKLTNGSTTGDAELALIRVGADGVTYDTAGDAVRGQIYKVLETVATDLTFEQGSIASADGTNTNNVTNRIRTGFVLSENFVSVSVGDGFIVSVFQYNANLGFISATQWSASGGSYNNSIIAAECRYVRFAVARSNATDIAIDTDTGFHFESSKDAMAYEIGILRGLVAVDAKLESGTLDATNGTEKDSDTRIRTGFLTSKFEKAEVNTDCYLNLFQYDANYAFLESTDFVKSVSPSVIRDDCKYIRFVVRRIGQATLYPTEETGFAVYRCDMSIDNIVKQIEEAKHISYKSKFSNEIMNTAYSEIGLAPINTAEHFHLAAHLGFNALKGDVRITSDNKLIMCHDAGMTLDGNGRITNYNSANCKVILNSTYAELMALEYATSYDALGHYAKVCDFDTFIRICKENGKIAYITLRENGIANLVAAVMETLKKYGMEERCVINSYTYATLREVRKYSDSIPLSQVISLGAVLNTTTVDNMKLLGNAIVTMFLYPTDNPLELWEQSASAIKYAFDNDIKIHMAQVKNYADYSAMVQVGVQGFHITKPFLGYDRTDIQFVVTMKAGVATFGNLFGTDKFTASVSNNNGDVTIKDISVNGSGYGYDDGLPILWMNKLPFWASVKCNNNPYCAINYQNGGLVLKTSNINGVYHININI